MLAFAAFVVALLLPAAGASTTPGERAATLRHENAQLAQRGANATLQLYALDSRLAQTRAELASQHAEASRLEREREDARKQVAVAQQALTRAQGQLADRLRFLYEQGDTDPLAVLLGATSLDEAINELESLNDAATQDQAIVRQTAAARARLHALVGRLAIRVAQVRRLESETAQTIAALSAQRAARAAYISQLASKRRLNSRQISTLEATVQAAETKAAAANARTAVPPPTSTAPAPTDSTLTVTATGYSLTGRTSTGLPVGWGVVAVDPSVIPLGTRLTIPGYGEGIAADTGGGVQGTMIDLWFPTAAQALGWGRRVVTITLH